MEKISGVPMLTADEQEIVLNGILYVEDFSKYGYDDQGKRKYKSDIKAHRVIAINPSARAFHIRSTKGCEQFISYREGCSRTKFYGNLASAKYALVDVLNKEMAEVIKEKTEAERKIGVYKAMISEAKSILPEDIKEPKPVKLNTQKKVK